MPLLPDQVVSETKTQLAKVGKSVAKIPQDIAGTLGEQLNPGANSQNSSAKTQQGQQPSGADENIQTLTQKDAAESEKKLEITREKIKEEARKQYHRELLAIGSTPPEQKQEQKGPSIEPTKKLAPFEPLSPGKPGGEPLSAANPVRKKQGTRELPRGGSD